jgi:hypothetical protein
VVEGEGEGEILAVGEGLGVGGRTTLKVTASEVSVFPSVSLA